MYNVNLANSVHQEVCPKQFFCLFSYLSIINFQTNFVFNYGVFVLILLFRINFLPLRNDKPVFLEKMLLACWL